MNHITSLQPRIVNCQQPIVVINQIKIESMKPSVKTAFATRINLVADILEIPPKGDNRQQLLGKMFGVSQEAARKWLAGESLPQMEKCIEIAKKSNVSIEWLLTGRGVAQFDKTPEAQVLVAMQHMDESTKYQVVKISNSLAEPKANGTEK